MEKTFTLSNVSVTSYLTRNASDTGWASASVGLQNVTVNCDLTSNDIHLQNVFLSFHVSSFAGGTATVFGQQVSKNSDVTIALETKQIQTVPFTFQSMTSASFTNRAQTAQFTSISVRVVYTKGGEQDYSGNVGQQRNYLPRIMKIESNGSDGYKCVAGNYLHPVRMQVSLNVEDVSTASITIADIDQSVNVGTLVKVETPHGDAGLFYVKAITTDWFGGKQRTLQCEHTWGLMAFCFIVGEKKASAINAGTGDTSTQTSNALNALKYVFNRQRSGINPIIRWYLQEDDFAFATIRNDWKFDSCTCEDAIKDVTDCLERFEWRFSFDYENAKAIAHCVKQDEYATAQVRENRNGVSLNVSVDMTRMYNVVYPMGKKNLTIKELTSGKTWTDEFNENHVVKHTAGTDYIIDEDSVSAWGLFESIQKETNKDDKASLRDWAANELLKNSTPEISVECNALELSNLTGVGIDRLSIGKRCRIPLPQYGTTYEDRICTVEWSDMIKDPDSITLTIANNRRTVQSVNAKEKRKQTKKNNEIIRDYLTRDEWQADS